MSEAEQEFYWQCEQLGLPLPEQEYRFAPPRRFRFDFAWPDHGKVAVEIEGGIWTGGRHVTGKGYSRDLVKYNLAAMHGWKVLRFSPNDVTSGEALNIVEKLLKEEY